MLSAGGSYIIVMSSRSHEGHAVLISPPVSAMPGGRQCLEFWWSASSPSSAANLSVRVLRHDGVLLSVAWNQSNMESAGAWKQASVNLLADGPLQVYICTFSI